MDDIVEVVVTSPLDWMQPFVNSSINDRLIACAHQVVIATTYRWEGEVHREPECRAAMHTSIASLPRLIDRIQDRHPYDVPCVMWKTMTASKNYAAWVNDSTSSR